MINKIGNKTRFVLSAAVVAATTSLASAQGTATEVGDAISGELTALIAVGTTLVAVAIGIWIIPTSVRVLKGIASKMFGG